MFGVLPVLRLVGLVQEVLHLYLYLQFVVPGCSCIVLSAVAFARLRMKLLVAVGGAASSGFLLEYWCLSVLFPHLLPAAAFVGLRLGLSRFFLLAVLSIGCAVSLVSRMARCLLDCDAPAPFLVDNVLFSYNSSSFSPIFE